MNDDDAVKAPPGIGFADQMVTMEEERTERDKIFERLLDPRNLNQNSSITKVEAAKFSRLAVIARKYDWDTLKELLIENLQHRNSIGREGRKDAIKLATGMEDYGDDPQVSGLARLFGGGRRR